MRIATDVGATSADLAWRAMAPHMPNKLTAGHMGSVCATTVSGTHPDTKDFFLLVEPPVGGRGSGSGKTARRKLAKGDVVRLVTATGGGYGDPRTRPREKVRADIRNGYVTAAQAERRYGLDPAAGD